MLSDEQLIKISKQTRKNATNLIKKLNIMDILSEVGTPLIIGSYELDLMIDNDIDIVVQSNNTKESAVNALNKFISAEIVQKYEFGDFVKFPRNNRPQGYIVNLLIKDTHTKWEIEIWFFNDIKEYKKQIEKYRIDIKDNHRLEILKRKYLRSLEGKIKHEKSSFEIYNDVLNDI